MLLSKTEVNILLTAGFYKAVPANLSPDLGGNALKELFDLKLLKLNRSKTTCRLTNKGISLLAAAGYNFRPDKHPLGDSDMLIRRLQSAEIALALQQIGVDVFLKDLPRTPGGNKYLSAYALRRNSCSNILGMAKFNGYYFAPETTYIIYHLSSKLSGFYPNTESETFIRHMQSIESDWQILFVGGKDYEEMFDLLHRKKESGKKNDGNFLDMVDMFSNVGALPLNSAGLRTLRIMNTPDYKERIVKYFKNTDTTGKNTIADGFHEGQCMQVNLDNNLNRQGNALKHYKNIHLIMPEQDSYWTCGDSEINRVTLSIDKMEEILDIGKPQNPDFNAFIGKNGKAIQGESGCAYA